MVHTIRSQATVRAPQVSRLETRILTDQRFGQFLDFRVRDVAVGIGTIEQNLKRGDFVLVPLDVVTEFFGRRARSRSIGWPEVEKLVLRDRVDGLVSASAETHTHKPFASAEQRLYLSATPGGESDLKRSYGIRQLGMIRSKSAQWGRRYVFVPGLYTAAAEANWIVAQVWNELKVKRAVLLAPSERILNRALSSTSEAMKPVPDRISASDITESVEKFTTGENVILALAGRYDGLDLPDEQCRLLILAESPEAVDLLERHLSEIWKMGPVLKKRERTRLMQGMGRCTRSATDFAIIFWIGQTLVDAATSSNLLDAISMKLQPGAPVPVRWYRGKNLETEIVCDQCTLRYAVSFRQACVRQPESGFVFSQEATDRGSTDLKATGDFGFADSLPM